MTKRNLLWRLIGFVVLAGAGGVSLLHREARAEHLSGPATGLELALSLLSFVLATMGMLLIINGARLGDDWARACYPKHQDDDVDPDDSI